MFNESVVESVVSRLNEAKLVKDCQNGLRSIVADALNIGSPHTGSNNLLLMIFNIEIQKPRVNYLSQSDDFVSWKT